MWRLLFVAVIVSLGADLRANPPAAARPVQLPFQVQDEIGNDWTVQQDGSLISPNGQGVFNGGGQLVVNGEPYADNNNNAQASLDAAHNEIIFPVATIGGLNVSRRVEIDLKHGWCRYAEVLDNPSGAPVHALMLVEYNLMQQVQQSQPVLDEKRTKKTIGLSVFESTHGVAVLGAGRGSHVIPQLSAPANGQVLEAKYTLDVPAKQTAVLVHVVTLRGTAADAANVFQQARDQDFLRDLPAEVRKNVVNFPRPDTFVGDREILRGNLVDVVELRGGDQYRGTIQLDRFRLQTSYGPLELSADAVVAMLTIGDYRPTQLVITADGEMYGGTLQSDAIRIQLSSGQMTALPVSSVTRLGYRRRPDEPAQWKFTRPLLMLQSGDRIAVEPPSEPIAFATRYGTIRLRPQAIASIAFQSDDNPVHEVELIDGSRFAGIVAGEALDLKLASLGGGREVHFPFSGISKLQLAEKAEEPGDTTPVLSLTNGDRLIGTLSGKLELETAFDSIPIDSVHVRGLRHGGSAPAEVQVTLWDQATLSGRSRADTFVCGLKSGGDVKVPVSLVDSYVNPDPQPPPQIVEKIRSVIAELNSDDLKRRDRAQGQLTEMGPMVAGTLKMLRQGAPPEAQRRIEAILAGFEKAREAQEAPPPPAPVGDVEN